MSLTPDLAASLAAGEGLLVPDRAAAVAVRLAFAAEQRRLGFKVWASPRVLTPAALLRDCAAAERQPLMSPALEWGLLRQFAHSVAEPWQANGLADAWQRSLTLLRDHGITPGSLRSLDTPEARLLLRARDMLANSSAQWGGALAPSIFWPKQSPANSRWRPPGFAPLPRAWRTLLATGERGEPAAYVSESAQVLRHVAVDPAQEIALAAAWVRPRLERGQRLLLVVPAGKDYESALQRALHSLVRLDGGREAAVLLDRQTRLADARWMRDVLFAIGWLCEALRPDAIVAGLQSGGCDVDERSVRAQIAAWYRQQPAPPPAIAALGAALANDRTQDWTSAGAWLQGLERSRAALGEGRERRSDWPERFAAVSAALPFDLAGDTGGDARALQHAWQELLQECAQLGEITGPISGRAALGLLTARAVRTRLPETVADSRLHVLRSRRDPVLAYDAIWVCGLAASQWPESATPDAWVPRSLQIAAGVAVADAPGRLRDAEQQLLAWRRACGELRVSQPAQLDEAKTSVSPLLRDVSLAPNAGLQPGTAPFTWTERIAAAAPAPLPFFDETFSKRIQGAVKGGVNLLDHYNDCPFRGAAEHRFGLLPEREVTPGVDPLESGSQLHEVLQRIWRELRGSTGLALRSEDDRQQLVDRHIDAVLGRAQIRSDARRIADEVQRGCLRQRVLELLALEARRSPFRVKDQELTLQLALAGSHFAVRIDRIDELLDDSSNADQQYLVIDYKSGATGKPNWKDSRLRNIQLLLYRAALLGQGLAPEALVTWHLGADGVDAGGATEQEILPGNLQPGFQPADWDRTGQIWNEYIRQLADGLWSGAAALQPAKNACDHCPLPLLCRRDARIGLRDIGDNDAGD